jgi:hypothetical protein
MLAGGNQLREFTLSPEEVERWASIAKPGDRIVYHRGPRLVRSPGVDAVTRLHDDGEIILNCRAARDQAGRVQPGLTEWLATRRAEPEKPRAPLPSFLQRSNGPLTDTRDEKERVLAVLKRHANLERACPSNREIAAQAGLKSADRAAYLLRLLIADQAVRVDTDNRSGFRVVTIVATGRKTAAAGGAK